MVDASGLARTVEKGNAAARVPEILRSIPVEHKKAVAAEIVRKLGRTWLLARQEKPWVVELLALSPSGSI